MFALCAKMLPEYMFSINLSDLISIFSATLYHLCSACGILITVEIRIDLVHLIPSTATSSEIRTQYIHTCRFEIVF